MDELIRINFDSDRPTVSGRDLHAALEVKTAYKDWFPRMCDYGFEEGTDFCSFLSESTGGRPATDHQLTIAMAKELCMIQRSEAGRKFRQYFIKVEETWNSPEAVMARALQFANNQLDNLQGQITILKSALEGLAISFGELLMPAIKQIVGWVQSFVDVLNGLDEGTKKTIVTIALIVAAIAPVLIIVGKVISAVGTIMTIVPKIAGVINTVKGAFAALNTTMLANPIVLIIAAIAALVAAFIYLWNNCDGFRQFWIDLWENVKQVAVTVWEAIKSFLSTAWEAIKTTATTVFGAIKSFFTTIWDGIKLQKNMEQVNLSGNNRIVFCGDYIDYGDSSYYVLKYLWDLQKKYGAEKVVVLKGNHEQMFLDWIEDYRNIYSDYSFKL